MPKKNVTTAPLKKRVRKQKEKEIVIIDADSQPAEKADVLIP